MQTPPKKEAWTVGFHTTNILRYLAQAYGTLPKVLREMVQNLLDAGADKAQIILDVGKGRLRVFDNGKGASREELRRRFSLIGERQKTAKQIGEKGIGNLAPIAILDPEKGTYRMITCPRGKKEGKFEIVLDPQVLQNAAEVTCQPVGYDSLSTPKTTGSQGELFTTLVDIKGITPAALRLFMNKSAMEVAQALSEEVSAAFSTKILSMEASLGRKTEFFIKVVPKDGSEANIQVRPIEFPGIKDEYIIKTLKGPVTFTMFLSTKQVKKPVVLVDHQGRQSFPLKNHQDIWTSVSDFFGSGYVQGRISLDFCTLQADRTMFVSDSELAAFQEAVDRYYVGRGETLLKYFQERHQDERYREVGASVLKKLSDTLPSEVNDLLPRHPGEGEGEDPGGSPPPPPPLPPGDEDDDGKGGKKRKLKKPSSDDDGKGGKKRKRRVIVQKGGIRIEFVEGDHDLGFRWHSKMGEGVYKGCILLNMSHEDFRGAEQKGAMSFNFYVTWHVLKVIWKEYIIPNAQMAETWNTILEEQIPLGFLDALVTRPVDFRG